MTLASASLTAGPRGGLLITAGHNPSATLLWDLNRPHSPSRVGTITNEASSLALTPDGHTLAIGIGRSVELWNVSQPRHPARIGTLTGHQAGVGAAVFLGDGTGLATGSADGTGAIWDLTGRRQPQATASIRAARPIRPLFLSGDGRRLLAASDYFKSTLYEWNPTARRGDPQIHELMTDVHDVVVAADWRTMLTAGPGTDFVLWDSSAAGRPERLAGLPGHADDAAQVAMRPDGRVAVTLESNHPATLWDLTDPRHPAPLSTVGDQVLEMAFANGGKDLLTMERSAATGATTWPFTLRIWDLSSPAHPAVLKVVRGVGGIPAVSDDGRTVVINTTRTEIALWDVNDPRAAHAVATLRGRVDANGEVAFHAAAFSPDGRMIATGDQVGNVTLWDLSRPGEPAPVATITGQPSASDGLVFGPGGRTLATADAGGATRLWDVDWIRSAGSHLDAWACAAAGGGLTRQEWNQYAQGLSYQPTC